MPLVTMYNRMLCYEHPLHLFGSIVDGIIASLEVKVQKSMLMVREFRVGLELELPIQTCEHNHCILCNMLRLKPSKALTNRYDFGKRDLILLNQTFPGL